MMRERPVPVPAAGETLIEISACGVCRTDLHVVDADLPDPKLLAYAKANPGKVSMASAGVGRTSHMSGELFKMMAGVSMVHVPYRGGAPALADLLGGQVQVLFVGMPPVIEYIKAGKLRALPSSQAASGLRPSHEKVRGHPREGSEGGPAARPVALGTGLAVETSRANSHGRHYPARAEVDPRFRLSYGWPDRHRAAPRARAAVSRPR